MSLGMLGNLRIGVAFKMFHMRCRDGVNLMDKFIHLDITGEPCEMSTLRDEK